MSGKVRNTGVGIYVLAPILFYFADREGLFWLTIALGLVYLATCLAIHQTLQASAKSRHKAIRDKIIAEGRSKEELDRFDQLPVETSREDCQSIPNWMAKTNRWLFIAGLTLLVLGIIIGIAA